MSQLGRFRIFAGHYQFILCDSEADPLDDAPQWDRAATNRGYVAGESVAIIVSKAALNNIVVAVELATAAPADESAERQLTIPMDLPSGELWVTSLDGLNEPNGVSLPPGRYSCHVLSYNLGADQMSTGELLKPGGDRQLTDRERFARTDYEHHRVVLVPQKSAGRETAQAG
jgi:hypothetical protein